MNLGTHVAFSSVLYFAGATLFNYPTDPLGFALAGIVAVLPDLDLPTSHIGRAVFWLSVPLERTFGHRTLTHSALGLLGFALLMLPLWLLDPLWFWCAIGGYWSHIWLDMMNIRGVDLFWPSPIRVVMPGRRAWRIEVGSKAEMVLLSTLLVVALGLYPLSGLGFRGVLQAAIGNFEIARDEFRHQAGSHWYTLELEAIDNLTLQRVQCACPVLGAWQEGLIVLHDGRPRAVGESQVHHDLYPLRARLVQGPPLTVIAQRVEMRGRSLRWLISRIDPERTYYLLGEIEIAGERLQPVADLELYRPASYRGNVLRLHYARAEELAPWLDLVAAQGEVYVQFWLRPGEAQVEIYGGEEAPVERVPEELRRFL